MEKIKRPYDVFISYAWGKSHKQWVDLLASYLHSTGYNVGIDTKLNYCADIDEFMQQIAGSKHVLMVVDQNYVRRANEVSNSGVAIENKIIKELIGSKPEEWLAVAFINNPQFLMPEWFGPIRRKSFDFNHTSDKEALQNSELLEDLWRWVEGLPADKLNAISPAIMRQRMCRIERIVNLRDPNNWTSPSLAGEGIEFKYQEVPGSTFVLGHGLYKFNFNISSCSYDKIYVYVGHLNEAVGLIPYGLSCDSLDAQTISKYLRPGSNVTARAGQAVVLLNDDGIMCLIKITKISQEINDDDYIPAQIVFDYRILTEEA